MKKEIEPFTDVMVVVAREKTNGADKVGCYDTINVYQNCPYCKRFVHFDAQTKDLGNLMYQYHPLDDYWFGKGKLSKLLGKPFRENLPVFRSFPLDKAPTVWKNQAEYAEAQATVHEDFKKLKFITVIADCHSAKCQTFAEQRDIKRQGTPSGSGRVFYGKIKIRKGLLIGKIYDIKLTRARK